MQIKCGVPQGSILGPILFLLYINDITNSTDAFDFRLFADDTNLFTSMNTNSLYLNNLNDHFNKVYLWCRANKLTISIDKTNYMIIKTAQRKVSVDGTLSVGTTPIDRVSSATYLGVSIDSSLTWKSHVDKVISKISPTVGIISRIRHYVPKSSLLLIYNSLILPHLSYCIEIWGNTFQTILKPLLLLQKKLVRLINFSDYNSPSAPLFTKLGILDIHKLCKQQCCLFLFDLNEGNFARNLQHYVPDPIPHNYLTRSSLQGSLPVPKAKLTVSQHNFKYAAVQQWNLLPVTIKSITNRHQFKSQLKKYLLTQ